MRRLFWASEARGMRRQPCSCPAEVVVEPRFATEAIPSGFDVLACGPEPMLHAIAALAPAAQLAWEAPMACGFGACYGCVVEIDGRLKRLCVEGPVLSGHVVGTVPRPWPERTAA